MISRFLIASALLGGTATAQLSGSFVINPLLPTGGNTFTSFADATAALAQQGVGGPCEFLVYDDAGPYNESNPFITSGVTYGNNDAVVVLGQWPGSSNANRVTFRAAPGERPVLDATGRAMGVFWNGADYVTLQGLEIRGAAFDGISLFSETGHGIAYDAIIDGCRIHDCGSTAITIYGNTPNPTNTLVQNCVFWNCQTNWSGGFNVFRNGYITTRRTINTRIVHNTFYVDGGSGSEFCVIGSRTSGPAEVPYAEVSHNVFYKLVAATRPIFRFHTPSGSSFPVPPTCDDNCFFDVSGGPFAEYGSAATTTAQTFADWQSAGYDQNSIEADPQFRDAAGRDFHLLATSPCIDASTSSAGTSSDIDGQPRTAPVDLGADEFSHGDYTVIGAGCPGTGGLVPTLDLWSWPFLGNPAFAIGFEQVPANAIVGLFGSLGIAASPVPIGAGCDVLLDPTSLVTLAATTSGTAGTASVVYSLPANASLAGFVIGYQGLALDAGAALGFSVSNALEVTFDF